MLVDLPKSMQNIEKSQCYSETAGQDKMEICGHLFGQPTKK